MHAQQSVQINLIFRKRRAARDNPAPKHAPRILIGLFGIAGTRQKEVKHLFEIRPVNRHLNREHAAR